MSDQKERYKLFVKYMILLAKKFLRNSASQIFLRYSAQRGFTIAEAIIAVSIIAIALVGIYAVVARSLGIGLAFRNELVAANLATEGVEIIRSIRDTNWLENKKANDTCTPSCSDSAWREGLPNGDWRVDYAVSANGSVLALGVNPVLNLDSTLGLYSYGAGTPTIFKRKVALSAAGGSATEMQVIVEVRWAGRGGQVCAANPSER